MSRLIVVSNRVSQPQADNAGNQGGLAMALAAALREYQGLWFGWSGQVVETFTGQLAVNRTDGVTTAVVDLEEQDVEEYYNGYANRTLWPLFHYRIDLTEYDRSFDAGYVRVNERLAETILPLIEPRDMIWVQDYHLFPFARELRMRGLENRIGFFLHIPWPPSRLLATLPRHDQLVESLFHYDIVGFHTEEWLQAFRDYVVRELDGSVGGDRVTAFGRTIVARAFPIGIDAKEFRAAAESERAQAMLTRMQRSIDGRQMIVGVDRLDYSKGIEDRFYAYDRFLNDNADMTGRVFLLQIAPPSRENIQTYQDIRAKLEALSGRINAAHADVDWVPLRYVNRGYHRTDLAGVYRAAAVGLVTPLRDGMNLVAKEYVAAQTADDPGVLVLSQYAGAALQLRDALIVNPYAQDEVAEAIRQALLMPLAERKRRWEAMVHNVMHEDVVGWRNAFVGALIADRAPTPLSSVA